MDRERQARAEAEHKYRVTLSQLEALTDHETRLREEKADVERRLASTRHDLKEVGGPCSRLTRHTTDTDRQADRQTDTAPATSDAHGHYSDQS